MNGGHLLWNLCSKSTTASFENCLAAEQEIQFHTNVLKRATLLICVLSGVNVVWCNVTGWRLWGGSHFVCVTWWNCRVFDHLTLQGSILPRNPSGQPPVHDRGH